jgi:uncharacterized protein (DUF427 family)
MSSMLYVAITCVTLLLCVYAFTMPDRPKEASFKNIQRNSELKMAKAEWEGIVIAESAKFEEVEGNIYFPPESLKKEFVQDSSTHTVCGWKGTASYYNLVVNGKVNKDAVWYYPTTSAAAKNIEGYVAFWKGVKTSK